MACLFNRNARIELHNIHATPLLLLQELSALGTVPNVRQVVRIIDPHAAVVEPLVLALRILALHHVVVLWLAAKAVLNSLRILRVRRLLRLLLLRGVCYPTSRVVVICSLIILRVLHMDAERRYYLLWFLCLAFWNDIRRAIRHHLLGIPLCLGSDKRSETAIHFPSFRRIP